MKRLICILAILGICFSCAFAEEETADYFTLLADLSTVGTNATEESLAALETDIATLDNPVIAAVGDNWKKVWLDPDYKLLLFGQDDPEQIPVSGKHAFLVMGFALQNGEMTAELTGRCDAAASAAKAFPDSLIVCTGGATGGNNPEGHTEAGMMKAYLSRKCGIDPDRILTDEKALTTTENAVNCFEILKPLGIDTITIITSSYHQKRCETLFGAMAARYARELDYSVKIAGNYCFEIHPEGTTEQSEATITVYQLAGILTAGIRDTAPAEEQPGGN